MGCGKWGLEREGQVPRRKAANRTETVAQGVCGSSESRCLEVENPRGTVIIVVMADVH